MRRLDTITGSADRLRIGAWRGDPTVALLSPTPGLAPAPPALDRALRDLSARGFRSVLTPALTHDEQRPFFAAGFVVHERLHLLRHHLDVRAPHPDSRACASAGAAPGTSPPCSRSTARPSTGSGASTAPGSATPAPPPRRPGSAWPPSAASVVGYHVTGRAGTLGYLQRLAVQPDLHGRGLGTALVADSLDWCRRKGCRSVLVNTQEANRRALSLYQHLGFRSEPYGLAVLEHTLDGGPPE